MTAGCPYCGAKLNPGLKFCVVCGRHVAHESMGKLSGGLRSGFRPADITRRLDELITVARFRRSRRSHDLERGARFAFLNSAYLIIAVGLFYAAIQFSLEMLFPGKFKETRIPVDKIFSFVTHSQSSTVSKPESKTANSEKSEAKPHESAAEIANVTTTTKAKSKQAKKARKKHRRKRHHAKPHQANK